MGPLCRSMGRRAQRRLRKNTARAMMTWLVASQVPTSAENQGSRDRDRDQDRHRHGRVHVQDLFSLWHHQQKTRVQEGVQVCQWPLCRSMVRRAQRRLRKNTARAMTWSQVRFRQVPKTKAAETET